MFRLSSLHYGGLSLLMAPLVLKYGYCAKLPSSIVLIVPTNDSITLSEEKSNIIITYGINETTTPLQFGYTTNTSFSLIYPNGTVLSSGGSELNPCRTYPGNLMKTFQIADAAGVYTLTANVTYTLPESGGNCSSGPFSYQSEIVSAAFNVLPANGQGNNGTQMIVTKTFVSQPTGSVRSGSVTRHESARLILVAIVLVTTVICLLLEST